MKTYRLLPFALLLFLTGLLLVPAPGRAATLTVTSAANSGAGTLRAVIAAAALGDTINFAPALNGQTIVLTSGEINVNKNLNILGPGPANLAVSGNGSSRVFYCSFGSSATLIAGLTITNGNGVGAIASGAGGAIANGGLLTVSNCTLTGNAATEGGGILNQAGSVMVKNSTLHNNSASIRGGGIRNSSGATLTLDGCTISNNVATANGGGIRNDGSLTVTNCTLSGNRVTGVGDGGGIANLGPVTLLGSAFNGNLATNGGFGGGLYNSYSGALTVSNCTFSGNAATEGGGICTESGTLTVNSSTLSGNSVVLKGGGICSRFGSLRVNNCLFSTNVTTSGFQAGSGGGIYQVAGGSLAASNCTFNGNVAIEGGGIGLDGSTGTVNGCAFNGNLGVTTNANRAATGGGIANGVSTLTVNHSTFSGNSAVHSGGGIHNIGLLMVNNCTLDGNFTTHPERSGGGIANTGGGTLTVSNSTLSGNSARFQGGGLFNLQSTATVINSTFSANSAIEGGGMYCATAQSLGAHLTIANSTFSDNSSVRRGASLHIASSDEGSLTISHTLLARPQGTTNVWFSPDSLGTVTNRGFNLADDNSAGAIATRVADLRLGPLSDHGGPTLTHALLPGSPAINAGTNNAIAGLPNDQRGPGFPRRYGARVDIGAYELQPPVLVCPGDLTTTNTPGQCGAIVAFIPTADSPVTCVPASGSLFPVGTNVVACTATNAVGTNTCAFKIIVRNAQPPVFTFCPGNISTNAPLGSNSVRVFFLPAATAACGAVTTTCVPASGSYFPLGSTLVTCTARDGTGGSSTCAFTVTAFFGCTANITVVNTNDNGAGSLRQALSEVCPGGTITFAPALNGRTIGLTNGELVIRTNVNILGPGATNLAITGNGLSRVVLINPGVTSLMTGLTITNGNGVDNLFLTGNGGGILNRGFLTISNLTISGNSAAGSGGGICSSAGTLTVQDCTVSSNSAGLLGGGICSSAGQFGGATVTVQNSTLNGNSSGGDGGGFYSDRTAVTILNSTLSGNSSSEHSGGIEPGQGGATIVNCTITANRSASFGGGLSSAPDRIIRVTNCIVAGNFWGATPSDISGTVGTNYHFNLIGSTNGVAGITNGVRGNIVGNGSGGTLAITSILNTNLAFNGGPTRTHSLVVGSLAINAGTNVAGLPATDQRGPGFPRVSGAAVDIGAYELQLSAPVLAGCPANVATNVAHGTDTRAVTWAAPTATGSPAPVVACQPPSGSLFSVGSTLVTCTATNLAGTNTCLFTVTVCATNIAVANASDSGAGSLRAAISNACPGGIITLAPALNGRTIVLTNGELVIGKNLTILGPGATNLAISGNGLSRVFFIQEATATVLLSDLTIRDGRSDFGGGIRVEPGSALTLRNSALSANVATGGGGGAFVRGELRMLNCTIDGNSSLDGGGVFGFLGFVQASNTTFSGNTASGIGGGAIWVDNADANLTSCTFTGNRTTGATSRGGAIGGRGLVTLLSCIVAGNFKGSSNTEDNIGMDGDPSEFANLSLIGPPSGPGIPIDTILDTNLAFNGGPTRTHAIDPGSPAIDAGPTNMLPNAWQIADVSNVSQSGSLNYTRTLTPVQKTISTNSGWHYTVVSRLVEGSGGGSPAQFMVHGNGSRRFFVAWDTNSAGQLVAAVGGGVTTNLTTASGAANYHTHELDYNPATQQATYRFDGSNIVTWAGLNDANQNGVVQWGSGASVGRGRMNYHHVRFDITGLGTVAEYFAGYQGSQLVAPHPTNQSWVVNLPATVDAVTNAPVSPDVVSLWPGVAGGLALDFDQRGPGYSRRSGRAVDIGAFEFQASGVALSFVEIEPASAGMRLRLQGAPNEVLSIQWKPDIDPGPWLPLTSGATDGSGLLQYIDTSIVGQSNRFYRAVQP